MSQRTDPGAAAIAESPRAPRHFSKLLLCVLTCVGMHAAAAEVRSFAAISLLGGNVAVVTQQNRTGSHMSLNEAESYTLPEGVFDVPALLTIKEAVSHSRPGAAIQLLKLPSAKVFGDPASLFSGERFIPPTALGTALKQINASHLLLVVPHRAPANIQAVQAGLGNGMLEGLGFYLNRDASSRVHGSGEVRVGYLAPYAYFKIILVDIGAGTVVRQSVVAKAHALTSDRAEGAGDPWELMTPIDKVSALRKLLTDELTSAMPVLLAVP